MGFINPFLYYVSSVYPDAFQDIIMGNNVYIFIVYYSIYIHIMYFNHIYIFNKMFDYIILFFVVMYKYNKIIFNINIYYFI